MSDRVHGKYSIGELLACVVARELKDDDSAAIGLNAELMLAASLLSQKLYSPSLRIRHGVGYDRGFELNPAAWTSNTKSRSHRIVEYAEAHDRILGVAGPSKAGMLCDTFFISGMQIDMEGNTNLIGLKGKDGKVKVRGPGPIGTSSISQLAKKTFIFTLEHSKRRLVRKVDYVSGIGHGIRKRLGIKGGPLLCITPLCVFDFAGGKMRILSIHPWSSLEEVLSKMSFKPIVPKNIPVTKEPSSAELRILRNIDRRNVLSAIGREIVA